MATVKSEYYYWNGSSWDLYYFKTSADLIVETDTAKVLTSDERTKIADYLTNFNGSNQLAKINISGYLEETIIPDLTHLMLSLGGGILTGDLIGTNAQFSGNFSTDSIFANIIDSNGGSIAFGGSLDFININSIPVINVPLPSQGHHAANKEYVDGIFAEGVDPVDEVRAASTANIASLSGLLTIDGIVLAAGNRVLVKNQTTITQNGIYTVSSGAWTKVIADSGVGALVFVHEGATQNDYKYYCRSDNTWILWSRTDTYGIIGSGGLVKTGTNFGVAQLGILNDMLAGGITEDKLATFAALDSEIFANIQAANADISLLSRVKDILSVIKLLRGTTTYNTSNAQTIAGAYTLAGAKNKTSTGVADPVGTGNTAGDSYLKELSRS
jgi:hypothetical protein